MSRQIRTLALLTAVVAIPLLLSACGGVPDNSVAKVNGQDLTKAEFNHWLNVAARSSQPGASAASIPRPPYTDCVAAKREALPKPKKNEAQPTDKQLKQQCQQEYTALRDQVMQFLITANWIEDQAKEDGVSATTAEVEKQFEEQKKSSFPKQKDFDKFLKQSGMTLADLKLRVKLDLLSNKIREKVVADAFDLSIKDSKDQKKLEAATTDGEIEKYYSDNQKQFEQPERRDLEIILTKNEAQANEAKAAIEGGMPFADAVKQYSTDKTSKSNGGKLPGITEGSQERDFDKAVFDAKTGELVGPVKTTLGYYVFKVTKVTSGKKQQLKDVKAVIRSQLISQQQQKALNDFVNKFRSKWRDRTECAKGYITSDCKNGESPKQKPAPGSVPSNGGGSSAPVPVPVPTQ